MGQQQSLRADWSSQFRWRGKAVTLDLSGLTASLSTDVSLHYSRTYSHTLTFTISEKFDAKDVDPRFTTGPKLTCSTRSREEVVHKAHCSGKKIVVYAWVEVEAAFEFKREGFWSRQWVASAEVEVSWKVRAEVSDASSDKGDPAFEGLPSLLAAGAAAVALAARKI
ncbi:unnamed protein product [Symbiodinium sp. CCMP2592]|nr:unnamed protein product [Symbiodinium sp. CCMP2592]